MGCLANKGRCIIILHHGGRRRILKFARLQHHRFDVHHHFIPAGPESGTHLIAIEHVIHTLHKFAVDVDIRKGVDSFKI